MTVDRSALADEETDAQIRLLVHASPAIAVPGEGGSTSYDYRPTELLLPADGPLPDRIRFRDLVPTGWGTPADFNRPRSGWPQRATMISAISDGAPYAAGNWAVVDLPEDLQRLATEFTAKQFDHLEQYWHPEDGSPAHPLSSGLHDVTVTIEDAHPRTRVAVTFRHPARAGLLLRRTYPVYDSAGRIRIDDYLAIWLMEDLNTGDLPPATSAVDGTLEI